MPDKPTLKRAIPLAIAILAASLLLVRYANFSSQYGGVEHDSGWYLGVAKNMAERGLYASFTNTTQSQNAGSLGIHFRPVLQDEQGFSYFPPGVTAGPAFIFPEALCIKVLGDGWWQWRFFPLAAFALLLAILFYRVSRWAGPVAGLFAFAWLWLWPQLTINLSYEFYGEPVAMLYMVIGYWLFALGLSRSSPGRMFAAGLFLSLSVLTKLLFFLSVPGPFLVFGFLLIRRRLALRPFLALGLRFLAGLALPVLLFETYRFLAISSVFGVAGWEGNNTAQILMFQFAGSGLATPLQDFMANLLRRLEAPKVMGLSMVFAGWAMLAFAPVFVLSAPKTGEDEKDASSLHADKVFWWLLFIKAGGVATWFLFLSGSMFTRHLWDVMVSLVFFSGMAAGMLFAGKRFWNWFHKIPALCMALLLAANLAFFHWSATSPSFSISMARVMSWYGPELEAGYFGMPPTPIFLRQAQEDVMAFFDSQVQEEDTVYYEGQLLVAEMSALVGKVFFPLARYEEHGPENPDGRALMIMGPYQLGNWPWTLRGEDYVLHFTSNYCSRLLFLSNMYLLCELE